MHVKRPLKQFEKISIHSINLSLLIWSQIDLPILTKNFKQNLRD